MRLVVTSDTHFPIPASLVPDGDALLVVGDLMYSGYPSEWNPRLDALAALPHKHKYLVAGNHDLHLEQYAGPAMAELRAIGVTVVGAPASKDVVELPNGMTLLGLPFVTNLPNWAFNRTEEWINEHLLHLQQHHRIDIVASHSPPQGILSRGSSGSHYGVASYRRFLATHKPRYWFCGHVHEEYGKFSTDFCDIYNVCMCDEMYSQVNPAVEVDL